MRAQGRGGTTAVLLATCVSALVVNANTSAVSILLPAISRDVGSSVTQLQWAVTAYSLVGAAVIVTSGTMGDIFGRRRIFLYGLLLFIVSCVWIAMSESGWSVIAGRAVQGASGATILACGMSLISVATSGDAQVKAVSLWGGASAVGASLGPLLGGALVDIVGWQGLFWVDAAIAVLCVPVTLRGVAESNDPKRPRHVDVAGTVLIAVVLVPVILGLTEGSGWGWLSLGTLACFALSAAALVAFVAVERRSAAPLLDLGMLRNGQLVGATLVILIGAAAINGLMYVLSIYLQDPATLHMSPLMAAVATLPAMVGMLVISVLVSAIAARIGTRQTIGLGFVVSTVGFAILAATQQDWGYSMFVLPLVAIAVGLGLTNGPASAMATTVVPTAQVGAASGISNMARYVGSAVAVAACAAVYGGVAGSAQAAGAAAGDAVAKGMARASLLLTIMSAVGIVLCLLARRHRVARPDLARVAQAAAAVAQTVPTRDRG
ncbi:MFS transporter [Luedemannella helvata]|uniref:MFS transporter n=1 Tax=Luedemannella helvata TaxID=349315 RepID=A0ABP4W1N5_9ACTN